MSGARRTRPFAWPGCDRHRPGSKAESRPAAANPVRAEAPRGISIRSKSHWDLPRPSRGSAECGRSCSLPPAPSARFWKQNSYWRRSAVRSDWRGLCLCDSGDSKASFSRMSRDLKSLVESLIELKQDFVNTNVHWTIFLFFARWDSRSRVRSVSLARSVGYAVPFVEAHG